MNASIWRIQKVNWKYTFKWNLKNWDTIAMNASKWQIQKVSWEYHIQMKHEKLRYNCNECEYMANTKDQLKYRFWFDLSATIKLTYIKTLSVFWFVSDSCTLFCNVAAIVPIILNVHYPSSGSTKQSGPTSLWAHKFGHLTRPFIYACLYMN